MILNYSFILNIRPILFVRDSKGRFRKAEGIKINFTLPPLQNILYFVLVIAILLPWISIGFRFNIFKKILDIVEMLMSKPNEDGESPKKNGIFY